MNQRTPQKSKADAEPMKASDAVESEQGNQPERTRPKQKFGNMFSFQSRFLTSGKGTERRGKRP